MQQQEIFDLFEFLSMDNLDIPTEKRKNVVKTAHLLANSWDKFSKEAQENVLNALKNLSHTRAPFQGAMVQSMLYSVTKKRLYLKKAAAFIEQANCDLAASNATFNSISGQLFNASPETRQFLDREFNRSFRSRMLQKNMARVKWVRDQLIDGPSTPFERNNRVVVLAKQLLRPPHAPSMDALNFARTLITEHNKEVLLIVTWELANDYDGMWVPCSHFNREDSFFGKQSITFDGTVIPLYMAGDGIFDEQTAGRSIAAINQFNPEMILSVSSPSLIAEAFNKDKFCFIYPTNGGVPLTKGCYFHTWGQLEQADIKVIEDFNLKDQFLFSQHPGFEQKQRHSTLTRQQFGMPEDAFVFVIVGLRLDQDVNDSFLDLLEQIACHPKAQFAFVGIFNSFEKMLDQRPLLRKKCAFLNLQTDMMAVYHISDAFLNPMRQGGGSSVVYAMQAALPVLSTPYGDIGVAMKDFPKLENYAAMATVALQIIDDQALYTEYGTLSEKEAPKFTGQSRFIARIIEEFEKYAENRAASASLVDLPMQVIA